MNIKENILTNNPCYKQGVPLKVKGLMLHSVGTAQPDAMVFIRQWDKPTYGYSCVHGIIDGNTGDTHQTLPWDMAGWHGGGSSNNTHIGVEMAEPASIKYSGGQLADVSNYADARAAVNRTYASAVELFAWLCGQFGLDPLAPGVIVSHKEGHALGIASNHGDPEHLWNFLNTGYTMNGFRADVAAAMGATPADGRYQTLEQIPDNWDENGGPRSQIKALMDAGVLKGDGQGLDLSEDMLRLVVLSYRAGAYDKVLGVE